MARMSGKDQRKARIRLLERDGPICYLCGKEFPEDELGIEHKLPRSRGGRNTQDNLGLSCRPCDIAKAAMTVEEYRRWQVGEKVKSKSRKTSRPLTHRIGDYIHYDPGTGKYVAVGDVQTTEIVDVDVKGQTVKMIKVVRDDKR